MARCPTCQNEIKDDFGLVTCSKCGNQVLINFDGSAAVNATADGPPAGMTSYVTPARETTTGIKPITKTNIRTNSQHDISGDLSSALSAEVQAPEIPIMSEEPNSPSIPVEGLEEAITEEPEVSVKRVVTSDMGDIADFANSPMSQAREGSLLFDIYISGIDTIDIRTQVRDALTDVRFVWDADASVAKLRNGELRLKDVSAIKSALIIQRLRSVPVDVRWEQHAIHQP